MKHITKLALSLFMILAISVCQIGTVFGKVDFLGDNQKYMYNGVIIASTTYLCEDGGSNKLWWTVYDQSKSKRDWPKTIVLDGNIVYETDVNTSNGGKKLCSLTLGNTYDIRAVFVHSQTKEPYYYLMIQGEGVTPIVLNGNYVNDVWVSDTRKSPSGYLTTGDGIATIQDGFDLDYFVITDNTDNPDIYHGNHSDFQNVDFSYGTLNIDLLWTPKPQSVTAENISVSSGEKQITVDKVVCEGNRISLYSKDFSRGQTYTVTLKDTMLTSRNAPIKIPLKTQYTIPYNDADILSAVLSDGTITLEAQNLTSESFEFTVLVALKSDDGIVNEVIVCDPCIVEPNPQSVEILIENLDFKSLAPEAFIVKSALLPVPVSDRSYK